MKLATREQAKKIDIQASLPPYCLSNLDLMEAAGKAAYEYLDEILNKDPHYRFLNYQKIDQTQKADVATQKRKIRVLVLCGPGNNGCDGFVVARLLAQRNAFQVCCLIASQPDTPSHEWNLLKQLAEKSNIQFVDSSILESNDFDIYIDAILGAGQNREIKGQLLNLVNQVMSRISTKQKTTTAIPLVLAIDIATGLDPNTGNILGIAIQATHTLCTGLLKPGILINYGAQISGKIKIANLTFPKELFTQFANSHFVFTRINAKKLLPRYAFDSHKYKHGKVLVIGGSPKFPGAGVLASEAAYRAGAGHVSVTNFDKTFLNWEISPEIVIENIFELLDQPKNLLKFDAILIGPGLGVNEQTARLIKTLKKVNHKNIIVDADGITTASQFKLWPLPATWIITPHFGELKNIYSNFIETKINEFADRYNLAMQTSLLLGPVVLLKGFRSIVATHDKCQVILSGNAALAKAGTGDVLAGFILAYLGMNLGVIKSASLGTYVHGYIADEWIKTKSQTSLVASDLIKLVPSAVKKIQFSY